MTKIIFFGTPQYVLPIPQSLIESGFDLVTTVTQPPKPVGRKKILTSSPVAIWSQKNNILNIDGEPSEIIGPLKELGAEVGVLAAYGRILPAELLSLFPKGIVNIHPSLLPKWRGPAPVEATIISRDTPAITFIKLDEEMDHGPILKQTQSTLEEDATKGEVINYLFKKAAVYLPSLLNDYLSGNVGMREQNHDEATYTKLLKKQDGFIPPKILDLATKGLTFQSYDELPIRFMKASPRKGDFFTLSPSPLTINRLIRALNPWPGAWTEIKVNKGTSEQRKRLKILKSHVEGEKLILDKVQLEGKNPTSWSELTRAYPRLQLET